MGTSDLPEMTRLVPQQSGRGSAWLERLVRDQEVDGSNPFAPTILKPLAVRQVLCVAEPQADEVFWYLRLAKHGCAKATEGVKAQSLTRGVQDS
jgi:hypothetical protein